MISAARHRAKRRGCAFDLTEQDVLDLWQEQDGKCYWFGVPMQWRDPDEGGRNPFIPTLDRADNRKGYTRGNVVLACWGANAAKGTCDLLVWEEFLSFVREARA